MPDFIPFQFIDEPIEVGFDTPPDLEKRPGCPNRFIWRGQDFQVAEMLGEWSDYRRRGRMKNNMSPAHAATAARHGSWGVGRFTFRVRTTQARVFDLYYDRAPRDADHRKGVWVLVSELHENEG